MENGIIGDCSKVKTNKSSMYWCSVTLSNGKNKIVIGELIDKVNRVFRLRSNSAAVLIDKTWQKLESKKGWHYKDMFEEDITFFDWNY